MTKPMNVYQPDPNAAVISIAAQYVKDLSFERQMRPTSVRTAPGMDLSLMLAVKVEPAGDGLFESELYISATGKIGGDPTFIAEISYGVLYSIRNMEGDILESYLNIEGPRHAFPFAAAVISQTITAAGMPPVYFDPVDFAALYNARLADKTREQR